MVLETGFVIIFVIILILVLLVALLWYLQKGFLFNQGKEVTWQPEDSDFVLVNGKISLWHRDTFSDRPLVLYCHGSAGNISDLKFMSDISWKGKFNLVMFDYQGYGFSGGTTVLQPTQSSVLDDGLQVYDWVRHRYQSHEIVLWGHSLGGAVVTYIAKQRPCHSVILMSTFSSLSDVAGMSEETTHRFGQYLIRYGTHNMPVKEWLKDVKDPVIILHSKDDELIPYLCAVENMKSLPGPNSKLLEIGGSHIHPEVPVSVVSELFERSGLYTKSLNKDYAEDIRKYIQSAGVQYSMRRAV